MTGSHTFLCSLHHENCRALQFVVPVHSLVGRNGEFLLCVCNGMWHVWTIYGKALFTSLKLHIPIGSRVPSPELETELHVHDVVWVPEELYVSELQYVKTIMQKWHKYYCMYVCLHLYAAVQVSLKTST